MNVRMVDTNQDNVIHSISDRGSNTVNPDVKKIDSSPPSGTNSNRMEVLIQNRTTELSNLDWNGTVFILVRVN